MLKLTVFHINFIFRRDTLKKIILKAYVFLLLVFVLAGCSKRDVAPEQEKITKQYILGGAMCNYGVVLEGAKSQRVTFPIITNVKIKTIEMLPIKTADDADIEFELTDFHEDCDFKYKDQYVYFFGLNIYTKAEDIIINTSVESAGLLVNGERFTYSFKNFKLCNDNYLCEKENSSIQEQTMFIDGGMTGIFGYVPDNQMPLNLSICGENDYNIDSFYFWGNYLKKEKTLIKGKAYYNDNIDLKLRKGVTLDMKTSFINEPFTENELIRDAFIIKYSDENGSYLFIYNSGLYIWRNFNELSDDVNGAVKNYIDEYVVK